MFNKPLIPYKVRLVAVICLFIFFFGLIWAQLFNLQVINSPGLLKNAKNQYSTKKVTLRGDIRDRNGDLLALDIITYDIYNNVKDIKKISDEDITSLTKILNIEKDKLLENLNKKINTRIATKVDQAKIDKIKKLNLNFIYFRPVPSRKYPSETFAAHILGFVNNDHIGQHGVEYFYNDLLTRINSTEEAEPLPKGTSIVLTIDSILQEYSEEILLSAIKNTKALKGTAITMSPKTGEIYAWATYPSYDPNTFYKAKNTKNWALTDIYEPGSTFKIITISSALENMVINKDSTFFDLGKLEVSGKIIRNHEKTEPRKINLLELFKHSSNVVAAQIGLQMEPMQFHDSIQQFMFGQKTNIDLPGESTGLLLPHNKWRKIDLATTAIGQGAISVTPLQIACATSAIANHGIWTQPHVLKGIWEPKYKLINENPFKISMIQVISSETADHVSELLKHNVQENLKAMAYIAGNVPGYKVAGKTGTAQKIKEDGKGYMPGHTIASFVGYFPADDPELLTLVVIDDPKTDGRWGNTVAGPVFNKIAKMAAKRILENT